MVQSMVECGCRERKPPARPFVPKEISWLSFNERVLQEAANVHNPLLERLKFLGHFSGNLDEFYGVRVANLLRLQLGGGPALSNEGVKAKRILKEVQHRVLQQANQFNDTAAQLFRELETEGILLVHEDQLNDEQARYVHTYFQNEVRPRLVPLLCDQNRKAPDLRDQFIYLAVELLVTRRSLPIHAFIEVPTDILSRFVVLPKRGSIDCVILLEDVVRHCLGDIFALLNPLQCNAWNVTVTRDSELDINDDSGDSYMDQVHRGLRKRRTGAPVRVVYDEGLPKSFLKFIVHKMKVERDNCLALAASCHNFKDFIHFPKLGRDQLVWQRVAPIEHPALQGCSSVLAVIAEHDILLHHPYHGFGSFVEQLREAALDAHVFEIAMTVYRVSPTSNVLNALINAARNGKRVTVVIELLARFDEENNLEWVNRLRDERVEVITGVRGLKVHAKLCLISRREGKRLMRFATIGTGNFNENTAQSYTDHILMTSDPNITHEVERLFEFFRSNYKVSEFQHLIVSPFRSRSCWRQLIHQEIRNARQGKPASVWVKLNNFADPKLVGELYEASQAGVQVRLIVRSMHTLVPGLAGISDRIEGISIVGRYLEHSRFLVFHNAGHPKVYITSGDWLPRNFEDRLEVACPINDPQLAGQLIAYFSMQWDDTDNARVWDSSLSNRRRPIATNAIPRNCHEEIRAYLVAQIGQVTREHCAPLQERPAAIPLAKGRKSRPVFADLTLAEC